MPSSEEKKSHGTTLSTSYMQVCSIARYIHVYFHGAPLMQASASLGCTELQADVLDDTRSPSSVRSIGMGY